MPEPKRKKLHISLPDDLHTRIRVRCAYENKTIQDYIAWLVADDMSRYLTPPAPAAPLVAPRDPKNANEKREGRPRGPSR